MVVAKINLIFIISSIFLSIYNIYIQNDCQYPIDNSINLNECYLIVPNLIFDKNNSVKTNVSSYLRCQTSRNGRDSTGIDLSVPVEGKGDFLAYKCPGIDRTIVFNS